MVASSIHTVRLGALLLLSSLLAGGPMRAEPPSVSVVTNITVRDTAGTVVTPLVDRGQKAVLFFFLMHDCPVANSYAPEINRIAGEYASGKIESYVVYVESDLSAGQARRHKADYQIQCRALLDPQHRLVAAVGATVSPEAALVSATGQVLYRGRIDDRVTGPGKRRPHPTRRDLRLALDAVLEGKPIPARLTRAIGCYIPDAPTSKSQLNSR